MRDYFKNMNPYLRGLLYTVGGVLLLLIILQILISVFADEYAGDRLKREVHTGSDSTYTLAFDDLDLNLFRGAVTIQGLRLQADSAAMGDTLGGRPPESLYTGTIGQVDVSGINVLSTLFGEALRIGSVTLSRPRITALINPHTLPPDSGETAASLDSTILNTLSGRYQTLELDELAIRDGQLVKIQRTDTLMSIGAMDLTLRDIRVDSASARSGRLFITDDGSLELHDYRVQLADSLNSLVLHRLQLSADRRQVTVDSLQLIPRYDRFEYSRKHGTRTDRIELTVPKLTVHELNYTALADSGHLRAGYAEVADARFVDFVNRAMPGGPPEADPLLFTRFRNMERIVTLDSLSIRDSYISYSEYLQGTPRAGTVRFEQLDATFRSISNRPEAVREGLTTTLDIRTRAMGTGLLNLRMTFPMDTQNGFHTIEGTLGAMDLSDFNPALQYMAFVRIDTGRLHSMEFNMTLDQERASGDVIMKYENFKISVLDDESIRQFGILENLKTFLANNVMMRRNNMPESGMQAGRIQYPRVPHKSIFNYWWKSLLSGIKDTIKR